MEEQEKDDYTWTIIAGVIYVGLLIYFGWQTWEFVTWLFPQDQLAMKCLSLLSFDIMAFMWACIDLFDRKRNEPHKGMVLWAWGLSFALSLLASILYLVIANMLRFNVPVDTTVIDAGEAITIFALTVNILFLTFWLYGKLDKHKGYTAPKKKAVQPATAPQSVAPTPTAPPQAPQQPAQPAGVDMTALLAAMQKMATDAAQSAANTATQQMMDKLTLPVTPAPSARPAQPSGPNTEQLAPFTAAPTATNGNGASKNPK